MHRQLLHLVVLSVPTRESLSLAAGFAGGGVLGLALEALMVRRQIPTDSWFTYDGMYGLGVAAGILVAFPVWRRVREMLDRRLPDRPGTWILLGLVSGAAMVAATEMWVHLQDSPSDLPRWVPQLASAMVIGLWNAFLLGCAFGDRPAESPRRAS